MIVDGGARAVVCGGVAVVRVDGIGVDVGEGGVFVDTGCAAVLTRLRLNFRLFRRKSFWRFVGGVVVVVCCVGALVVLGITLFWVVVFASLRKYTPNSVKFVVGHWRVG